MESVSRDGMRGQKMLREAVKDNDTSLITEILSTGKSGGKSEPGDGEENILDILLGEAIEAKRHHLVDLLLNNRANCQGVYKGKTHLSRAVLAEDADILQSLLNSGADVTARDPSGKTVLHEASARSNGDTVRLLIRFGADVEAKDGLQGNTPMHVACTYCNRGAIQALFEEGASVNATNHHLDTPLAKVLGVVKRKVDFHDRSRLELGKELLLLGFRVLQRKHVPCFSSVKHVTRSSSDLISDKSKLLTDNSTEVLQANSDRQSLDCYKRTLSSKADKTYSLYKKLFQDSSKSLTLQGLCRLTIVTCLSHSPVQASVGKLGLPVILQRYLVSGEKKN